MKLLTGLLIMHFQLAHHCHARAPPKTADAGMSWRACMAKTRMPMHQEGKALARGNVWAMCSGSAFSMWSCKAAAAAEHFGSGAEHDQVILATDGSCRGRGCMNTITVHSHDFCCSCHWPSSDIRSLDLQSVRSRWTSQVSSAHKGTIEAGMSFCNTLWTPHIKLPTF